MRGAMGHFLRLVRTRTLLALVGAILLVGPNPARASFLDNDADLGTALSLLRAAIGAHVRVLRVEVDPRGVAIEAQDPRNRSHVDRWRYGVVTYLGVLPLRRLSGPEPVRLQLINPDLEANLFDLDAVDFSAMPKLVSAALARAKLQDAAAVTHIEIARQTFIVPQPTSGDIRLTLRIDSGREHAEIYANARSEITGANLGGTIRAQNLNIFAEPALVADAAAAFRDIVGAGQVLTKVRIDRNNVSFATNVRDQGMAQLGFGMPATAVFTWDLDGLQRRLGSIDVNAQTGTPGPAPFGINDVNWTILDKLAQDALARAALAQGKLAHLSIAKSSEQPGAPILVWTVEIAEPSGEVTSVIADAQGAIKHVVLAPSRRPKANWLDAGTIAEAIARIAPTFGADAKIASIVFDDKRGRVTIDDPANGGRAATFEFNPDGVTRASISFSLDSMGPRFSLADIASLDQQKIAALQAEAFERLARNGTAYLESVSFGAHPFVRQAGAHAIEVRLRNLPEDSVRSSYAWIVFDFSGRVLDFVTF